MPTSVLTVLSKVIVNTSIQGTGTYAGNGVQAAITTNVNSGTTGLGTNNPVSIATGLVTVATAVVPAKVIAARAGAGDRNKTTAKRPRPGMSRKRCKLNRPADGMNGFMAD